QLHLDREMGLGAGLTLDDRDSYRVFAMEPSCNPGLWSHATPRTWVVHHVTAAQMQCMWAADVAAGIYTLGLSQQGVLSVSAAMDLLSQVSAGVAAALGAAPEVPPLPDLCSCLAVGPLAAELSQRKDKINASRTYLMWGDPNSLDLEE
ncbi:unnamed protein product, partial [Polarella glacialis]